MLVVDEGEDERGFKFIFPFVFEESGDSSHRPLVRSHFSAVIIGQYPRLSRASHVVSALTALNMRVLNESTR